MKVILGIGNIGKEYEGTRHNIGFDCIDNFCKNNEILDSKEKFGAVYFEKIINDEKVYLIKPQKYVNLSGAVLRNFIEYFNIDIEDILIIVDDLNLNVGKIKLKYQGSSGGHNGLKNIEENLKTNKYKRLKIGISNNSGINMKNYVLSKFKPEEKIEIEKSILKSEEIIKDFITQPFEKVMGKYN